MNYRSHGERNVQNMWTRRSSRRQQRMAVHQAPRHRAPAHLLRWWSAAGRTKTDRQPSVQMDPHRSRDRAAIIVRALCRMIWRTSVKRASSSKPYNKVCVFRTFHALTGAKTSQNGTSGRSGARRTDRLGTDSMDIVPMTTEQHTAQPYQVRFLETSRWILVSRRAKVEVVLGTCQADAGQGSLTLAAVTAAGGPSLNRYSIPSR
jgi:hypothetical protein